jgi:hypothetical protein
MLLFSSAILYEDAPFCSGGNPLSFRRAGNKDLARQASHVAMHVAISEGK